MIKPPFGSASPPCAPLCLCQRGVRARRRDARQTITEPVPGVLHARCRLDSQLYRVDEPRRRDLRRRRTPRRSPIPPASSLCIGRSEFATTSIRTVAAHRDALKFPDGEICANVPEQGRPATVLEAAGGAKDRDRVRSAATAGLCELNTGRACDRRGQPAALARLAGLPA